MSQQEHEFVPGPQQPQNEGDEIYSPQYPYHWSGKVGREAAPRDEPPLSYDASIMQGYRAQGEGSATNSGGQQAQQQAPARSPYNTADDGDAYEQGYRARNPYEQNPYGSSNAGQQGAGWRQGQAQQQGVPPWARPQPQPRRPMRFGFIILILVLIALLQGIFGQGGFFIGGFADIVGTFFAILFGAVLLPIFLLMMVLAIFGGIFRRAFWPGRRWRRGRSWYWRGPWGW